MAVTLPIVGDSEGTWGTILNTAITDIDTRLTTATNTNVQQDGNINGLNNRVTALEIPPAPMISSDGTNQLLNNANGSLSTSPGSPVVGVAFNVPPSGKIRLTLTGGIQINTWASGSAAYVGVRIRSGLTVGAGTDIKDLVNTEPGCRFFYSPPAASYSSGGAVQIVDDLTPGDPVNVSVWHFMQISTTVATVLFRQIIVDFLPS